MNIKAISNNLYEDTKILMKNNFLYKNKTDMNYSNIWLYNLGCN